MQDNQNMETPEESLGSELEHEKVVGSTLRWISVVAATIAVACLVVYWRYLVDPEHAASPGELELSSLLLAALGILAVIWTPWEKLGIRLKKIGGLEFETIMGAQATEHARDIADLLKRVKALESQGAGQMGILAPEVDTGGPLNELLMKFLSEYSRWAFSPLRIQVWGGRQPGYESLKDYSVQEIRNSLIEMVSEGALVTRISQKGNTIYRVP